MPSMLNRMLSKEKSWNVSFVRSADCDLANRPLLCLSVSVCQSVRLSVSLSVRPSVYLSTYLPTHPQTHLPTYRYIYIYIYIYMTTFIEVMCCTTGARIVPLCKTMSFVFIYISLKFFNQMSSCCI